MEQRKLSKFCHVKAQFVEEIEYITQAIGNRRRLYVMCAYYIYRVDGRGYSKEYYNWISFNYL